jgi:hypothetical protein
VTVTEALAAANTGFEQESEKTVVCASEADCCVPEVASEPDSAPPPVHALAFCDDQLSAMVLFGRITVVSAVIVEVGAPQAATETVPVPVPPAPVQLSV